MQHRLSPLSLPWHVFALIAFVVKDVDTLQLEVVVTAVVAIGIDTVFSTDSFPEFLTNL